MESILQGLMELVGARATMVLDGSGRVVAHLGHAVYDRGLCDQMGGTVTKAIESIQLQQEDWDTITAHFADGRILLRRVGARTGGSKHVLAIVADSTLNASFATVALRVAANKIRSEVEGGTSQAATSSQPPPAASQPLGSGAARPPAPPLSAASSATGPADSRPVLANTGLSWSKSSNAGSSSGGLSSVVVTDPASSAFLTRCAKELARHVGPMSKVYVQEAVRRVCPDAPFSITLGRQLVDDLATQIEDTGDRAQFRKAALEKK
jgi:predicted regulator of Ras-like GTPase activity (Roadblock/LC7/MglB family)